MYLRKLKLSIKKIISMATVLQKKKILQKGFLPIYFFGAHRISKKHESHVIIIRKAKKKNKKLAVAQKYKN